MNLFLRVLDQTFAVCKVESFEGVNWHDPFIFIAKTDDELSLVCPVDSIPANATDIEKDWRCFKVDGQLDFGLIGILAEISRVLAEKKISLFVVSTFNTDYVLVKAEKFEAARAALGERWGFAPDPT